MGVPSLQRRGLSNPAPPLAAADFREGQKRSYFTTCRPMSHPYLTPREQSQGHSPPWTRRRSHPCPAGGALQRGPTFLLQLCGGPPWAHLVLLGQ